MRALLGVILIAAAAWSGYWFVGASGARFAFEQWFKDRRAEGWAAEYADLAVQGFPNRFDTNLTDVTLADPETGLAWDAPFLQIFALSYQPNHIIAVWPNTQRIATPLAKYDLASTDMRASLVTQATRLLPLERLSLTADTLQILEDGQNDPSRINSLRLAADRLPTSDSTYRLGFFADGFEPASNWREQIDAADRLPDALDALSADMTVEFDKPWDLDAIQTARPQPRKIELRLAQARWGQLELQAAGQVAIDVSGQPEGVLTIKAQNWREILQLAVQSGTIPQGLSDTLDDGLSLLSQLAGNPKTLDIPLGLRGGSIWLGPVPIGPAPQIILR